MAKSYIKKAIDKTLKPYESSKMGFSKVDEKKIEELRKKLYAMIIGNEEDYQDEIDERLDNILSKNSNDVSVNLYNKIPKNINLNKSFKAGKAIGVSATLLTLATAITVSCGANKETTEENITPSESIELVTDEVVEPVVDENKLKAEEMLKEFSEMTKNNTIDTINSLLGNGVKMIDNSLNESEKELIAGEWLQYYLVANIDDITTLEYANFMKEQPGAVLDNDDLISNFRNMNVLLKGQMLVCTPDNKIDFSKIYNEVDAEFLNNGTDIIARLNTATKTEDRKNISKEFYDYIQNTILDQTDKLKYSNSAMATFINVEFGAWTELTKNSNYKRGYYPDDELEAKLMTVVSNCGLSKGEKNTLDIEDETKKSLESINVIRVLDSLNSRKDNIPSLSMLGELYYLEEANYGNLRTEVTNNIDLNNYKEIESFTEKKEKEIKNTKPVINKNDSQVSNGQGGTIAKDDMIANGVNPSDQNAKEKYEEAVKKNFEENAPTKVVNSSGETIDKEQAEAWAKQGAIDANGSNKNDNVPPEYQEAYNNGWNAANSSKQEADKNTVNNTTTETVTDGSTEITEEEKFYDFQPDNRTETPSNPGLPSNSETNTNTETKTEFVPIDDGEIIIEETEEVTGFAPQANAERSIEVKTLTKDKVNSYKELKSLLQQAMNSYQDAINIYEEISENNMSK